LPQDDRQLSKILGKNSPNTLINHPTILPFTMEDLLPPAQHATKNSSGEFIYQIQINHHIQITNSNIVSQIKLTIGISLELPIYVTLVHTNNTKHHQYQQRYPLSTEHRI
jgi:hypothetical protein